MVPRLVLIAALATLVALPASAQARCPISHSNPRQIIDWDTLQAKVPTADPRLAAAVRQLLASRVKGGVVTVQRIVPVDNRVVATWQSCFRKTCRGGVAYLNSNPDKLRVIRRGILPHNERVGKKSRRAFRVTHTLVDDFDHDGNSEVIVRYEVDGPKRPITGIRTWEHVAIYNLPNMRLQLFHRTGIHGGGELHKFCSWTLERRDVNCDKKTDLILRTVCGANKCFTEKADERTCRGQPSRRKIIFRYQKDNDTYATRRGFMRVKHVDDARPYLVVAGSFAVAGTKYLDRAKKLKRKLILDGFKDAMIHNSREFKRLSCCYRVVIAGRFRTKAEAKALVKAMRAKRYRPYVRKGF